jgi:hypothetical protein
MDVADRIAYSAILAEQAYSVRHNVRSSFTFGTDPSLVCGTPGWRMVFPMRPRIALLTMRGIMTITKISQTPPDKANELFARLLDTSDASVQTREQLFSDLKQELELLASVQKQHLFPVLEKHDETKSLVHEALEDSRQTQALLDELETTPKDSDAFMTKLTDLQRVFQ